VFVYEPMHAKRQAKISVPPTRSMVRRIDRAALFKTPGRGKLKGVWKGFWTE